MVSVSNINPAHLAMVTRPVAPAQKVEIGGERGERAPARGKGAHATALNMADDLTALASSFANRRAARSSSDTSAGGSPEEWLAQVLDEGAGPLHADLKQVALQTSLIHMEDFRALLLQYFPDRSDAIAVLRSLIADDELEELRQALEALLLTLESSGGQPARAGLNIANAARASAARAGPGKLTSAMLRQCYRSLLGSDDATQLYVTWLEVFGFRDRRHVIDFLGEALVADMCCIDPSCSEAAFGRLLRSLRLLCGLRTIDEGFTGNRELRALVGEANVESELVSMLSAMADEEMLAAWCHDFIGKKGMSRSARAGSELAMALRRFIRNVQSPELLTARCRNAAIVAIDRRLTALEGTQRRGANLLEV